MPSIDDYLFEPVGNVTYCRNCPEPGCSDYQKIYQPVDGDHRINQRHIEERCSNCGCVILGAALPRM